MNIRKMNSVEFILLIRKKMRQKPLDRSARTEPRKVPTKRLMRRWGAQPPNGTSQRTPTFLGNSLLTIL